MELPQDRVCLAALNLLVMPPECWLRFNSNATSLHDAHLSVLSYVMITLWIIGY
jgi:hypothetical protein